MQEFPHRYSVNAAGSIDGDIPVSSRGLPTMMTAAPSEFGGPGDRWSPETMLVGAVATCFILTFRAVARAMKLRWDSIVCEADGTLDRVDRVTQFTAINVRAIVMLPPGTEVDQAQRALERAEQSCLITSSLKASVTLETKVLTAAGVS